MSAFLTLDSIAAVTPDGRTLFDDLTLAVGAERVGLVGRNGSGKSTLLAIAAGDAAPARGSVIRTGTVGTMAQDWPEGWRVAEGLGVAEATARLARVLAGDGSATDLAETDWTLEARIDAALGAVGLGGLALERTLASLSGGERARLAIARLHVAAPDLLLLDEPTNNLDAAGRAAVEELIAGWRGGVIVASHDRALLERVDRIVALSALGARSFGGGWSAYAAARDADRDRAEAELARAAGAVRETERAAQASRERQARRDRAGRAFAAGGSAPKILLGRQAERAENSAGRGERLAERSRMDAAGRLEEAQAAVERVTPLTIALPPTGLPPGRELLAFDAVTLEQGGCRVLGPLSFAIRGPERVALTGPNGAGKTSAMRLAMGGLAPTSGTVRCAEGRLAMLDQHVRLLDDRLGLVDNLRQRHPEVSAGDAHAVLARFAFRNRDALRLAGTLSGGERLRAGLACVLGGTAPVQLLLLDEPTNHLDVESIEVLEAALAGFDGALMVVSHDRAFLNAIGVAREVALG
ncbi:ABC-F family ATP-binding cassette domain-containing protein [Sphingomonas sp.]|uniref:ABC-F family ATP-binding cassette domain-containing protein n=1 Tax=Sphingomonas sp. TaxID=28214 RepID=UPI002C9C15A3|nr:ABC-F family ATP-binding cassette domain-containing protein [Sphingomonas sp.]HWK36561.1 ABC-F family ATP-binding cassette domain-containing protein [Sphingomonas sp.]